MELVLVKLKARNQKAEQVQHVLTQHGCDISLRVGLHEVSKDGCSDEGLIILHVKPGGKAAKSLVKDLKTVGQLEVKTVEI